MSKASVLIITYHQAPNYGAFLQAYAMQRFLEAAGVDGECHPHCANAYHILTRLLEKRIPSDEAAYRNGIRRVIADAQEHLKLSSDRKKTYDLALLGSDEIWNIRNRTALPLPVFFRPFKRAGKTISYAACAGSCKAWHLKLLPYTRGIRRLDAVSVRDEHTGQMLRGFGIAQAARTLDPAFLWQFEKESAQPQTNGDYLLVYTYGLPQKAVGAVKAYAEAHGLKIIATGSKCPWADENPLPTPFEWLSLIRRSKGVVTSTFHGCVFSILFGKQFAAICSQSNKIRSLLEEMQLSNRLTADGNELGEVMDRIIDYEQVGRIIRQRANESARFILTQLEQERKK